MIAGGAEFSYASLNTTLLYDPQTNKFSPGPNMLAPHSGMSAIPQRNGDILYFGGNSTDPVILKRLGNPTSKWNPYQVERYNYKKNVFEAAGLLDKTTYGSNVLQLNDGKILLKGNTNNLALYDPVTNSAKPFGNLKHDWAAIEWTVLQDGSVLIVGTLYNQGSRLAEVFDPKTQKSRTVGDIFPIESPYAAQLVDNGKVLIAGQVNKFFSSDALEVFDPYCGKFQILNLSYHGFRGSTMLRLNNGTVLLLDDDSMSQSKTTKIRRYVPD